MFGINKKNSKKDEKSDGQKKFTVKHTKDKKPTTTNSGAVPDLICKVTLLTPSITTHPSFSPLI